MDDSLRPVSLPGLADTALLRTWAGILEHLPDAVLIVANAAAGGRILYLNPQASRMFGYDAVDLIDQPVEVLVPRPLAARHLGHRQDYARAPRLRSMGAGLELRGRRRDGSEFPIDVMLNSTGEGPLAATLAIVRDLSERRELEAALVQARDSAIRANEVKSRFLAAASHDLRQPLQTIWSLQSVLSRALHGSGLAPHLELLGEAVRNMDQILSSLVDINRLEKGAIQPLIRDFPLREILARLRSEFGYAASSKSLELQIEESPEHARSDPMLLPVILRNLVGNAIKYTQHGSVRLRVRGEGDCLHLDVIDTGPGIPAAHRARLFEAFYQVDNPERDQRHGVGLGLSIVQTICRLLDHGISIESTVGAGSTFSVQLPRGSATQATQVPPLALPGPAKAASRPAGRISVLHIEDDPGIARALALLLRLEGYDVVTAASRDEALQQVQVHGVRPDLILCDFQLPMGHTGDRIVAELAAVLKARPPIIMLTGDIADAHIELARAVADRILPKPVDINLLLQEITALLARSA